MELVLGRGRCPDADRIERRGHSYATVIRTVNATGPSTS